MAVLAAQVGISEVFIKLQREFVLVRQRDDMLAILSRAINLNMMYN